MNERIYLGLGAHVVCIDRRNGGEYWRTQLKSSDPLTLVVSEDVIIAYAGGSVFGLEKITGRILWENGLSGLGYGRCVIATDPEGMARQVNSIASAAAAQQSSSSSD